MGIYALVSHVVLVIDIVTIVLVLVHCLNQYT